MLQQVTAVFLVLALLGGALLLLQRKGFARFKLTLPGGAARSRQMHSIEKLQLSPQHALHLVEVGSKTFLIGISPSGCEKVASWPASTAPEFRGLEA